QRPHAGAPPDPPGSCFDSVFKELREPHSPPVARRSPRLAVRQRLIPKHSPPSASHSLGSMRSERPGSSHSPRFALPGEPAPRHSPALTRSEPQGTGRGDLAPSCTFYTTPRSPKGMRHEGRGTLHSPRIASSRPRGKPRKNLLHPAKPLLDLGATLDETP